MNFRVLAVALSVSLGLGSVAWAQFGRSGSSLEAHLARPDSFDGRFHYCRAVYRPNPRGDGGSWLTDYPLADIDLSIRLSELTKIARQLRRRRSAQPPDRALTSDELFAVPGHHHAGGRAGCFHHRGRGAAPRPTC